MLWITFPSLCLDLPKVQVYNLLHNAKPFFTDKSFSTPLEKKQTEVSCHEIRSKLWKYELAWLVVLPITDTIHSFKKNSKFSSHSCLASLSPYFSTFILCTPGALALYSSDSGSMFKIYFHLSTYLHPKGQGIYLSAILDECLFPSSLPFLSPGGSLPGKTQIQLC